MKTKCLNCGAEIIQKEGARERKFCDNQNKCKQAYHNKNKKEPKYVQYKTFKELQDRFNGLAKENQGMGILSPNKTAEVENKENVMEKKTSQIWSTQPRQTAKCRKV